MNGPRTMLCLLTHAAANEPGRQHGSSSLRECSAAVPRHVPGTPAHRRAPPQEAAQAQRTSRARPCCRRQAAGRPARAALPASRLPRPPAGARAAPRVRRASCVPLLHVSAVLTGLPNSPMHDQRPKTPSSKPPETQTCFSACRRRQYCSAVVGCGDTNTVQSTASNIFETLP